MTDIEQAQKQRQAVYFLVEADYKGFNIVVYEGRFLGLRHGMVSASQMLGLEALQARYGSEDVIVCDSVDAVRVQIDHMRELQEADLVRAKVELVEAFEQIDKQNTPRIIESRHGFNIVSYRGKSWVLDQSVGKVDFCDEEQLRRLAASGHLLEAGTDGEAKAVVDNKVRRSGGGDRK